MKTCNSSYSTLAQAIIAQAYKDLSKPEFKSDAEWFFTSDWYKCLQYMVNIRCRYANHSTTINISYKD